MNVNLLTLYWSSIAMTLYKVLNLLFRRWASVSNKVWFGCHGGEWCLLVVQFSLIEEQIGEIFNGVLVYVIHEVFDYEFRDFWFGESLYMVFVYDPLTRAMMVMMLFIFHLLFCSLLSGLYLECFCLSVCSLVLGTYCSNM